MASVYEALAEVATNPRARNRLIALSATEKRHEQAWAELLATCGVKVPDRRPTTTARALALFARVVGIGPALALAGVAEGQVLRGYLSQVSTVSNQQAQGVLRRVLPEELDHQSPDDVAERDEDSRSPVVADEERHGGGAGRARRGRRRQHRSTRRAHRRPVGDGRVRRVDGRRRVPRDQVAARGVR